MHAELLAGLQKLVGPHHVMAALEDRICYSFDATFKDCVPDVVVRPKTPKEISEILRLAKRLGVPVTPRGAATGLSGGAVPVRGGVSLDLTRLNKILEIDPVNRTAAVEPGVITADFVAAVSKSGLFFPPDPASSKISTIGGNVAVCSGGPRGVKYGVTRDYVLGLEVVLPDGEIVRVGNTVDGESAGPDWTMLFVGSEGTLGIITKIFFRLVEKPEAKKTLLAEFDDLDKAAQAVCAVISAGIIPTTMEIMDNTTIRAVEDYLNIGLPVQAEAVLLIEVDGAAAGLDRQAERVSGVCKEQGATLVQTAQTRKEADHLWRARRSISPACGKINPTKISEDATVPRSQVPAMVRRVKEISEKYQLKMVIFGHAGDGNLHPNILTDKRNAAEMARVEPAIRELFQAALELGGTLSGEHGIGSMKAPFLEWELGQTGLAAGRVVKECVDQNGILNPGKLFCA